MAYRVTQASFASVFARRKAIAAQVLVLCRHRRFFLGHDGEDGAVGEPGVKGPPGWWCLEAATRKLYIY